MLKIQLQVNDQGKFIITMLKIINECMMWRVSIFMMGTVEN